MCGEIGASGCHTSTQVGLAMSRPHPPLINPCQLDFAKRNKPPLSLKLAPFTKLTLL